MTPAVAAQATRRGQAAASSTASEKRGHASIAHAPNVRSVSAMAASPATGSTHTNVPLPPKCPYVAGELRAPVQCGVRQW